jgi:hypothetical protein
MRLVLANLRSFSHGTARSTNTIGICESAASAATASNSGGATGFRRYRGEFGTEIKDGLFTLQAAED